MAYEYNLIAIGAGAAGLVTTYIGAAVKAKVALIERHKMGGDCLNTGCVPSKALISSAKAVSMMKKHEKFGLTGVQYEVDFAKVMERVQDAIKKIEPHDSVERYTGLGVHCIQGEATILSPNEVEVDGKVLTTANIVVATGARPFIPPVPGLEDIDYLHSDNVWDIRELPKRLLVIGGGAIGCELAQSFCRLGSKVTLMDILPNILPKEDPDIVKFVLDAFDEDGVSVKTGIKISSLKKDAKGVIKVSFEKDGKKSTLSVDKVLVAAGRKANTTGFGLEKIGVKLTKQGTIEVDEYLRTNVENVYACGDVAGPYQFTHMAGHQAWYAAVNSLFSPLKKFKVDYSVVPWVTYTDPEIAQVGLNESEAKRKNISYEITRYPLDDLDRAITDRTDYGVVKILTVPGRDKILGVTICGVHAGDMIAEFILAMKHGIGLNKILGTIHPYPTLAEANKMAAGVWRKAHVVSWMEKISEKFHATRRS